VKQENSEGTRKYTSKSGKLVWEYEQFFIESSNNSLEALYLEKAVLFLKVIFCSTLEILATILHYENSQ
jgi:hypothetical protein